MEKKRFTSTIHVIHVSKGTNIYNNIYITAKINGFLNLEKTMFSILFRLKFLKDEVTQKLDIKFEWNKNYKNERTNKQTEKRDIINNKCIHSLLLLFFLIKMKTKQRFNIDSGLISMISMREIVSLIVKKKKRNTAQTWIIETTKSNFRK